MKLNKVDDKTAYENLLIKYAELENQIADIKANSDLAIEGRDIKIKELEDHLAEEVELHLHAEEYIKSLEQQIEKMKCCKICVYGGNDFGVCYSDKPCINKNKWELAKWVKQTN